MRSRRGGGNLRRGLSRSERDVWDGTEGFADGEAASYHDCPDCIERDALKLTFARGKSNAIQEKVASCETCGGTGSVRRSPVDPYKTPIAIHG